MKPILSYFLCLVLLFSGISCVKKFNWPTKKAPTLPSIQGLWVGTYLAKSAPNQPPYYFSFNIQPGGVLSVQAQSPTDTTFATGTWTLSGDTLQCNYTYFSPAVAQSATAIYISADSLTSGVWQDIYNSGTFSMGRK